MQGEGSRTVESGDPPVDPRRARPKGGRALLGAAIAIVGALAAVNPTSAVLRALAEAVPQLAAALPPLITAVGAILAAVSEPPEMAKRRLGNGRWEEEGESREGA
jgi:hypothetical protein